MVLSLDGVIIQVLIGWELKFAPYIHIETLYFMLINIKGSRSHLQISLNMELCKDEKHTIMMYMKYYSCRL